ncbi:uncharacterized protein HVO_A0542 (plasmid) [Haloferax volcanii DS2]|uniref:Uncharacterized protein n=1 Tax=Haloferax volcanii (strain ATCC 29605 / DSM 3757 / JCM 8879 / NBRC 14742 / NCIMB 2012 / VKM B-1768 / DS2) TaxID=309800 RepID=D4GRK4_HALVD|nr:uncharacterized protein HVO_A0542 [Haloferax volcanii DS2]
MTDTTDATDASDEQGREEPLDTVRRDAGEGIRNGEHAQYVSTHC